MVWLSPNQALVFTHDSKDGKWRKTMEANDIYSLILGPYTLRVPSLTDLKPALKTRNY